MPKIVTATRDVIVRTERLEEAAVFYADVLGLHSFLGQTAIIGFEAGGFRLFVERGPDHSPVFEFLADDFDATKAALLAAGATVIEEDASVPRCYLRDPFGLVFNLGRRSPG